MQFSVFTSKRSSLARWTCAAVVASVGVLGVSASPASAWNKPKHNTPTAPLGYTFAAWEGKHVKISGIADVMYGAHGKFNRKTGVTGGIDCTNAVFGNPDKGVTKACFTLADVGPAGYSYATTEGSHLNISGLADVAYGSRGRFNRKTGVTGGIGCDNSTFGDPDKGVHKSCYILSLAGPAGYTYAGPQNAHISFSGMADVAFGDRGKFNRKTGVTGGIDCTNAVFGNPDPGVQKSCYILSLAGPAGFTYAGPQNSHITISGTADVAFGDRGKFFTKTGVTGGIDCTNAVFGNPDPGVQKSCYTLARATVPATPAGPAGYTFVASEGGSFTTNGVVDVAYGAGGLFNLRLSMSGHFNCDNATWGDAVKGVPKACFTKPH